MESNLNQWAGEIRAHAEVLADIVRTSDFRMQDVSLMVSQCVAIQSLAESFAKHVKEASNAN